jgi:hypothetical protein
MKARGKETPANIARRKIKESFVTDDFLLSSAVVVTFCTLFTATENGRFSGISQLSKTWSGTIAAEQALRQNIIECRWAIGLWESEELHV